MNLISLLSEVLYFIFRFLIDNVVLIDGIADELVFSLH